MDCISNWIIAAYTSMQMNCAISARKNQFMPGCIALIMPAGQRKKYLLFVQCWKLYAKRLTQIKHKKE
jgi:hypothetical protein